MTDATDLATSIAARIVAEFSPDRVVLFGSRAWGQPSPTSDIDLLVVVRASDPLATEASIACRCRPRFVPMDVLVRTPEQVAERLRLGDPFMKRILEQGRVLYDRGAGPGVDRQG